MADEFLTLLSELTELATCVSCNSVMLTYRRTKFIEDEDELVSGSGHDVQQTKEILLEVAVNEEQ